jgi:MerR family transcriptional regulator/heat shock protein HspR
VTELGRAGESPARPRRELRFPGDAEPQYTVGQVAALLGVQPAFLRRLEQFDAIDPARSAGGQRRYSRDEVERIDAISALMAEGLSLAGALQIFALQAEVAELRRRLAELEGE